MSGPAHGNRSRATALAVRELVALHLQGAGLDATPRKARGRLSDAAADALAPDIDGVPGTWITVSARTHPRFWDSLPDAQRRAALTGKDRGVVVHWRSSEPIGEAFVVLALDDFAAMLPN
jgi:hypothetical protein